ncbi:hypothetical protein AQUCO_00500550v1 [Aquilegia coerulea]|uniref:Uncharacterized protein n=1 Tax=Aquilegia coerulea TaxID=218851 RepID=A0A2G5ESN0_AQUCA|nr:hypothetical protein AQUCO_00500550v1 [Aquilegia coerulea]
MLVEGFSCDLGRKLYQMHDENKFREIWKGRFKSMSVQGAAKGKVLLADEINLEEAKMAVIDAKSSEFVEIPIGKWGYKELALAYDGESNIYKILKVYLDGDAEGGCKWRCTLMRVSDKVWGESFNLAEFSVIYPSALVTREKIYLLMGIFNCTPVAQYVAIININSGTHDRIKCPKTHNPKRSSLVLVNQKLHLCHIYIDKEIHMWSLENSALQMQCIIPLNDSLRAICNMDFRIAQLSLDEQIGIVVQNKFLLLNLETKELTEFRIPWASSLKAWNLDACVLKRVCEKDFGKKKEKKRKQSSGLERFWGDESL